MQTKVPASRSHLGLKKIQYITKGRKKKRPENLKWWRANLNLEESATKGAVQCKKPEPGAP